MNVWVSGSPVQDIVKNVWNFQVYGVYKNGERMTELRAERKFKPGKTYFRKKEIHYKKNSLC